MEVLHDQQNHKFYCIIDDQECFVEYSIIGKTIDFYHTFVPPELREQGIAKKIYARIAEWLDEQETNGVEYEIKTSCSYAEKYFNEK